ncbi:PhzF family phenazine biosynthesis protein [Kineococcus gypseus]|uniref:PhzF family phenazine biosynthesis protein n=1 Tax=Kineococcus gypseus TaxID=1637102 RepID=UPI003D7EE984
MLRYSAFSRDPAGGNPAGVVLDARGLDEREMLAVAAEVGFSETAFLVPADGGFDVRFFSPRAEVSFCGHATIASAVAHAERHGAGGLRYRTAAGDVDVVTARDEDGSWRATLTSVPPVVRDLAPQDLDALLAALRWSAQDLDPALPARTAYAGAWHPVVAVRSRQRLADLEHDVAALERLAAARGWTTVDLVWRQDATTFHARNPFPAGGVVEDPATGAAAAALGGYLRAGGHVPLPARLTVLQGEDLGRPSTLHVAVPADPAAGVAVTGAAVAMP